MNAAKQILAIADLALEHDGVVLAVFVIHETENAKISVVGRKIRRGNQLHAQLFRAAIARNIRRTILERLNVVLDDGAQLIDLMHGSTSVFLSERLESA